MDLLRRIIAVVLMAAGALLAGLAGIESINGSTGITLTAVVVGVAFIVVGSWLWRNRITM